MEREGGEGMKKREGRGRRGLIVGGMVLGLLFGCNNGVSELEKRNTFFDSIIKIGQGFQEIFGIFGNTMGEALGFDAVKSTDTRSKVGEHFEKIKKGLESTNGKLKELSGEISNAKNDDTKGVEAVISSASAVITKLIESITTLASVTKGDTTPIGSHATQAVKANKDDVEAVINGVKEIIGTAKKSDIKLKQLEKGKVGTPIANGAVTSAPAALLKNDGQASAGVGAKLANEVAQADPWAMIDKIKSATNTVAGTDLSGNNGAGALATGIDGSQNDAAASTNADLAAAVMTKNGKFNTSSTDVDAVKAAAANAVNKVLGVLDEIIRRTVEKNLEKVREAVNKIKYSDTNGEATKAKK